MLFTENNLKRLIITKNNNFRDVVKGTTYIYHYACVECGYPFLANKTAVYCGMDCKNKSGVYLQKMKELNTGKNNPMYGKKNPAQSERITILNKRPDIIQKRREIMIGKNNPMYGKKRSDSSERMKLLNKIDNPSKRDDVRQKLKDRMSGCNNHQWKGGISCEPYCTQWSDKEYKQWLILERDNGKCHGPECNSTSTNLVLHHINYDKKDCRPVNLITLCNSCNGKANKDREWHEAWYSEIMRRRGI